jgi:hypothetical protein
MSYGPKDPRSQLATAPARPAAPNAPAQYLDLTDLEPDEISDHGSRTWWVRGQNFALAYTVAQPGETLERADQPDEYVVLFPQETAAAKVIAGSDESAVPGAAMVVVPAGGSRVEITAETHVARLFSAASRPAGRRVRGSRPLPQPRRLRRTARERRAVHAMARPARRAAHPGLPRGRAPLRRRPVRPAVPMQHFHGQPVRP